MCFLVDIAEERRTERLWLCDWLLDKYCDFTIFPTSFYCLKHNDRDYRRFNFHKKRKRSGNTHNQVHVSRHKVSPLTFTRILYNLWREIQTTQLTKCPSNSDCTTSNTMKVILTWNITLHHFYRSRAYVYLSMCISEVKNEGLYSQVQLL